MSDFGTDVGNSGLTLMGKLIDALLKLIAKIYDTVKERTGADYKLKKAEYGEIKNKTNRRKFTDKIEGKTGFVKHKDLERAGVPLTAVGVSIDEVGLKELSARCKREGIVISGVEDIRERALNGNQTIILECKQSDLTRLSNLIDLMNDEKKIARVQEEILSINTQNVALLSEFAELKGKEEPTQEEADRMVAIAGEIEENNAVAVGLNKQIDEVRHGHSQELNREQAQGVVEQAVNGETLRGVTFDEAVNRWTGGSIDKDTTCFVVDAKDPSRYIVCTAQNNVFHDKDYIKTTYQVYKDSTQVYATNDRRFDGRPKNYWTREKAAMRDAGGFSDLVIKFYSIKELEAYREYYKEQNAAEIDGLQVGKEGRDYDAIIKTLEIKMDECGAVHKDGVTVSKETDKPLLLSEQMDATQRATVAEAVVIGKQIDNYQEIKRLESDIAVARTNVLVTEKGTPEYAAVQVDFENIEKQYDAAFSTEVFLVDERKCVNAVQAEQDVQGVEKTDDRREEKVNELDDEKQLSMAEYKGKIEERRTASGTKDANVKDKEMTKQHTVPTSKEDR